MGLLDAPSADWRGSPVAAFNPLRDLPAPLAVYDFSALTASDGAAVSKVADRSSLGHDLIQPDSTQQPTKQTGSDGLPVLRIGAGQCMQVPMFGTGFPAGGAFTPPLTIVALVKISSSNTGTPCLVGGLGSSQGGIKLLLRGTNSTGVPYINGGTAGTLLSGRSVFDDQWHVIVGTVDLSAGAVYVDGFLTSILTTTLGTDGLRPLNVGSLGAGSQQTLCDLRWLGVFNGRLSFAQVEAITTYLAGRAPGITVGKCATGVGWQTATDANSIACRLFAPTTPTATKTVVLWSHPYTQNEQATPAYWLWPLIHATTAQGWYFAATNQHGDSWGSDSSVADLSALLTLVEARYGTTTNVILAGGSMGGIPTLRALATGAVSKTKGAYLIDAVCDLAWSAAQASFATAINTAWGATSGTLSAATTAGATSLPTTASFPTVGTKLLVGAGTANAEVVTTTAASTGSAVAVTACANAHASADPVSNIAQQINGKNPAAMAASAFSGKRVRFVASTSDATVAKASNTDAMRTLIGSTATESGLLTHGEGHLSACVVPSDFVAFVQRCIP